MAGKRGRSLRQVPNGRAVYAVDVSGAGFVRWAVWPSASAVELRTAPVARGEAMTLEAACAEAFARCRAAGVAAPVKIASWWATPAGLAACRRTEDVAALVAEVDEATDAVLAAGREISDIRMCARRFMGDFAAFAPPGAEHLYLGLAYSLSEITEPFEELPAWRRNIVDIMARRPSAGRGQA